MVDGYRLLLLHFDDFGGKSGRGDGERWGRARRTSALALALGSGRRGSLALAFALGSRRHLLVVLLVLLLLVLSALVGRSRSKVVVLLVELPALVDRVLYPRERDDVDGLVCSATRQLESSTTAC